MIKVNDIVILKAKTKHGKDRLHQHGPNWRVKRIGSFKGASAVYLESSAKTFRQGQEMTHDGRWVELNGDPNFEIISQISQG